MLFFRGKKFISLLFLAMSRAGKNSTDEKQYTNSQSPILPNTSSYTVKDSLHTSSRNNRRLANNYYNNHNTVKHEVNFFVNHRANFQSLET